MSVVDNRGWPVQTKQRRISAAAAAAACGILALASGGSSTPATGKHDAQPTASRPADPGRRAAHRARREIVGGRPGGGGDQGEVLCVTGVLEQPFQGLHATERSADDRVKAGDSEVSEEFLVYGHQVAHIDVGLAEPTEQGHPDGYGNVRRYVSSVLRGKPQPVGPAAIRPRRHPLDPTGCELLRRQSRLA